MLEIQSRVDETMVEFNELSSFSPHPDPGKLPRVFDLCAYAMDFPVEQMMEMTGPELCERTFESDACRQILMTPGGVLGAWRAVRPRAGCLRHDVRAVLHDRGRNRRQRGPGRRADPLLPRPRRAVVDVCGSRGNSR